MRNIILAWTHAMRFITERKPTRLTALFFVMLVSVTAYISIYAGSASAATNSTINFQARVLSNTGAQVSDGFYSVEFKIYDTSAGPTSQWSETQVITSKNGYITANLGSVNPFGSNIDWSQEQWLSMNINADGEMSPRMKITAVPLAFRAVKADSANNVSTNATNSASTDSASISVQTGNALGVSSNSGNIDIDTGTATGSTGTISIGATNASGLTLGRGSGGSTTTLQGGSGGVQISSGANVNIGQSDTNGTLLVVDVKTNAGDPAGTNGAIYYNQTDQKFRCFENGAWIDCIQGAPYTGTSATLIGGLQNVLANQTAAPIENMVFTTNTAVSTVAASGGFTAPADGSFRSCLVQNTANITAGTLTLRWRVNGVSVGSAACPMGSTAPTNRESSTILNPGVVTFNAGDVIDVAFDTSAGFLPSGSNDFTVYWGVEYTAGSGGAGSGGITLQDVYDQSLSASLQTTNNRDITFNLADTVIDSDFVVNVASGSTSRLVVQNNGTDTFSVNATGDVTASGGLTVGNSSSTTAGTIRWTGTDFEGYDGANWISLTTGSGGGGSGVNMVSRVKQVNESVISNITPQDDDELTFPIGPNEEWTYRFVVQANAAAAADLRFAVAAPTGALCNTATSEAENSASDAQVGCGVSSAILNGGGTPEMYEITGSVKNGATPGNVTLRWAQFTSNATNTIVYAGSYVQAIRSIGAGGSGQPFVQDGNSFGATAVLGTNDTNDLIFETDGIERITVLANGNVGIGDTTPSALFTVGTGDALQVNNSGDILTSGTLTVNGLTTIANNLVASGSATGTTGTTSGTGTNTTTLTLAADSFAVNDVIYIDNIGQDYYTRIIADPGTGSYTVSPAITFENARTVTKYNVQNIGATSTDYSTQANRFFQGYFLGGLVVGAGSTTISDGLINSTTTLRLQSNGNDIEIGGSLNVTGVITGDASGLTNIDGSQIASGSIADGSLSANVTLAGNTFNGASQLLQLNGSGLVNDSLLSTNITKLGNTFNGISQLVQLDGSGNLPALNASALTNLNASNISSGTVADGRLSSNVTLLGNSFNSNNQLVQLDGSGLLPSLNASALTNINGSNIASGTVADARLSTNVTVAGNTFNGANQLLQLNGSGLVADSLLTTNVTKLGNTFNGISQLVQLDGSGALPALNASALTSLNATNISSGTLADARLSTNVTVAGNTFNGANQLLQLNGSGALPAVSGSGLTSLNASNISSGTVADARLSTNVTLAGNTFNGANQLLQLNASGLVADSLLTTNVTKLGNTFNGISQLVQLNGSGALPALNAAALTSLNATNISSGTLADARLSTSVTLAGNTFNGASQLLQLNGSGALPAVDGSGLTSLTATNISSGTLADARLSANVGLINVSRTYSTGQTFAANITLGTDTASPTAGLLVLNDATGSNGFTSVLGTNTLTATRNINLPNESGTVCLSSSTSCGFILLAPGTAQTDSSTNNSLFINKTGASGDILTLQKNGTSILRMLNSGALQLALTDTAAFTVENAGGTDFFNVDTSGGLVRVGTATADATGVLFVLDNKNTAGDPTGVAGGQYYNSNTNKFRCFENGAWKDCIYEQAIRSFVDATSDAIVDNNTTNYWDLSAGNNNSYPNITLSQATGKSVLGIVTIETTATSNNDVEITARIERGIGAVPTCNAGTQVGAQPGTFSSNNGGQKASTVQFVDTPNTTSPVYYVLCADTATVGTAANLTRIRVTLQEVSNTN